MVKAEFGFLIKAIVATYPNTKLFQDPKSAEIWYQLLSDLDYKNVAEALAIHARTNKFAPTVAELREGVKQLGLKQLEKTLLGVSSAKEIECKPREFDTIDELVAACGTNYSLAELEHVLLKQAERLHNGQEERRAIGLRRDDDQAAQP